MKRILILLSAFALMSTTACKKSKDAPAYTVETVSGAYKLDKVTFKMGSSAEQVITDWSDACEADDLVTLKTDMTYSNEDVGQTCNNNYNGTWGIPSATQFDLDGEVYTLANWDGSTLAVSTNVDFGMGEGTVTLYYKRQ